MKSITKVQKGFTLIELMVVIVIIGILSALAIPKMFGVSSKAKAAEAPGVVANWETLQSAYSQETGTAGTEAQIGFVVPTSMWFAYSSVVPGATATFTAAVTLPFGNCAAADAWVSDFVAATDATTRSETGTCPEEYTPNFD